MRIRIDRQSKERFLYGLGDALDRVGATVLALSLMGGWFSETFTAAKALIGMGIGLLSLLLGIYAKISITKDNQEAKP